jgi:hypothetical protein
MTDNTNCYKVLGSDDSYGDLVPLTDFELGLVLGGNASDVTGGDSQVIDHVGHVSSFATIGGAIGGQPGAMVGVAVGVAYEVYEHAGDALGRAAEEYQNNPPPI